MNEDQFLDHSEWDDTVHSSDALDDGDSTIVGSPKTKKVPDASQPRARDSSPPTSQLMKKFFPTLASKQKVIGNIAISCIFSPILNNMKMIFEA